MANLKYNNDTKKSEDYSNPVNYRPISITACLARLFERLLLRRIQNYMCDNNILIYQQAGFRARRQTKDNLFFLTQNIKESFRRKKNVCSIFFDKER